MKIYHENKKGDNFMKNYINNLLDFYADYFKNSSFHF